MLLCFIFQAVLEYVIFCHQEESAWPLGTAKDLKTKFDDIFAATKYTKALDNIKKFRSEQLGKVKVLEADLRHLKEKKEKADEIQKNLEATVRRADKILTSWQEREAEKEPLQERQTELHEKLQTVMDQENELGKLQTKAYTQSRIVISLPACPNCPKSLDLRCAFIQHHEQVGEKNVSNPV